MSIYLTDFNQRAAFLAAMQVIDPTIDPALTRFNLGSYTLAALKAGAQRLLAAPSVESVAVEPDGSGLRVWAVNPAATRWTIATLPAEMRTVPIVVEQAPEDHTSLSRKRDVPHGFQARR